jgi:hypothetical protein
MRPRGHFVFGCYVAGCWFGAALRKTARNQQHSNQQPRLHAVVEVDDLRLAVLEHDRGKAELRAAAIDVQ